MPAVSCVRVTPNDLDGVVTQQNNNLFSAPAASAATKSGKA